MDLFSRFDCVRVINLESRPDRRKECLAEFKKHKMPMANVSFYTAVKPTSKPDNWANYTMGTWGCYNSHLNVLREFLRSGQGSMLVCEDDIKLLSPRSQYLGKINRITGWDKDNGQNTYEEADAIPFDWDILYFSRCDKPALKGNHGWRRVWPSEGIMGLTAYAVNRKSAAYLIKFLQDAMVRSDGDKVCGPLHVDGGFCRARALNPDIVTYLLEPHICHFRASATDIHDDRMAKLSRVPVLRSALGLARKIKNSLNIGAY